MVELRKRAAPPPAPLPKTKKAKAKATEKVAPKADETEKAPTVAVAAPEIAATAEPASAPVPTPATVVSGSKAGSPKVGDTLTLNGFGGEIATNDGETTTFAQLVEDSKAGVVLFTYPKASTPGCTTQACLFRDAYDALTATGLSIYGLSTDSPKANTTFKTKQKLPYPLLCDPSSSLIAAIGFKKAPKGTSRAVFVVDKAGKVLAAEAGGPAPTVEVVKKLVASMTGGDAEGIEKAQKRADDQTAAETAAEVADAAERADAA